MRQLKTFKELKLLAKSQMSGKMGTLIAAMLIPAIIYYSATEIVSAIIQPSDVVGLVMYQVISFIVKLLMGTIIAGAALLRLHVACNMDFSLSDLFHIIKTCPDRAIKVQGVLSVISLILAIPSFYYSFKFGDKLLNYYYQILNLVYENPTADISGMIAPDITVVLGCSIETLYILFALITICGIFELIINIGFYPVFYLMLDFQEMSIKDIFSRSWSLMKGHKGRFFLLQLTFIPFYIISLFTFMLPLLWVIPYKRMTEVNFYLDLIAVKHGTSEMTVE